jgi:WD40-like Beta Propeller Repeat
MRIPRYSFWRINMKRINLLLFFITELIVSVVCISAQQAPKAGEYYCYTTTIQTSPFGINPILVQPAFFGNLILDGKGNYKLTRRAGTGRYSFNKSTSKLSFTTGDLKIMAVSGYKSDSFQISNNGLAFNCTTESGNIEKKPGTSPKDSPKILTSVILNEGLTGKILTTTSYRADQFGSAVFEFDLAKGVYNQIFPNGIAAQNSKGEIFYIDSTSRMKITDRTGTKTLKQLSEKLNYNFDDFYPAISNSGEYIAFTYPLRSKNGTASDDVEIVIADRQGETVAEIKGYTQAAWMPDGRVLVAGSGKSTKGLFLIDTDFKKVTRLFDDSITENATMPAISPDGKTLAFVKNQEEIWIIKIDGSNPKKINYENESRFPAWSPDGKYLAFSARINVNEPNRLILVIADVKTGAIITPKYSNETFVESRNRINWLP